jgi:hypothetical protein
MNQNLIYTPTLSAETFYRNPLRHFGDEKEGGGK